MNLAKFALRELFELIDYKEGVTKLIPHFKNLLPNNQPRKHNFYYVNSQVFSEEQNEEIVRFATKAILKESNYKLVRHYLDNHLKKLLQEDLNYVLTSNIKKSFLTYSDNKSYYVVICKTVININKK